MGAEEGQRNQNPADESDSIALVTFYFFHLWDYNRVISLTLASPPFKFFRIPLLALFFKFIASFAMNCYSMDICIHIYIPHITWPVCIMLLACPFSGLNILHSRTNWCAFPEGKTISPAFSIPQLPAVLSVQLRPCELFSCPLRGSIVVLVQVMLGRRGGETLWVWHLTLIGALVKS